MSKEQDFSIDKWENPLAELIENFKDERFRPFLIKVDEVVYYISIGHQKAIESQKYILKKAKERQQRIKDKGYYDLEDLDHTRTEESYHNYNEIVSFYYWVRVLMDLCAVMIKYISQQLGYGNNMKSSFYVILKKLEKNTNVYSIPEKLKQSILNTTEWFNPIRDLRNIFKSTYTFGYSIESNSDSFKIEIFRNQDEIKGIDSLDLKAAILDFLNVLKEYLLEINSKIVTDN